MADAAMHCQDAVEFLCSLSGESVDMVMTSPPYDGIRDYTGFSVDLPAVGEEVSRVLKPGGIAVMVIQDQTKNGRKSLTTFRTAVDWVDRSNDVLGLFECCLYRRDGTPGKWWSRRFRVDHEYILVFVKGKRPQHFDKSHMMIPCKHAGKAIGGTARRTDGTTQPITDRGWAVPSNKCRGTVMDYSSAKSEPGIKQTDKRIKTSHPATFPDKLAEDFIRCFCPPGGLVVDPFAGSGTSLIAAVRHGRQAAGCDVSQEYCRIAQQRFEHHGLTLQVQFHLGEK